MGLNQGDKITNADIVALRDKAEYAYNISKLQVDPNPSSRRIRVDPSIATWKPYQVPNTSGTTIYVKSLEDVNNVLGNGTNIVELRAACAGALTFYNKWLELDGTNWNNNLNACNSFVKLYNNVAGATLAFHASNVRLVPFKNLARKTYIQLYEGSILTAQYSDMSLNNYLEIYANDGSIIMFNSISSVTNVDKLSISLYDSILYAPANIVARVTTNKRSVIYTTS